jgi:hypothetical protein
MRLEYRNQRINVLLDGEPFPADVDVVIYAEPRRRQFWTARGQLADQPEIHNDPNPEPVTRAAALLLEEVGMDVTITTENGWGEAMVVQADVFGHVDMASSEAPPWPVPNPHVSPR